MVLEFIQAPRFQPLLPASLQPAAAVRSGAVEAAARRRLRLGSTAAHPFLAAVAAALVLAMESMLAALVALAVPTLRLVVALAALRGLRVLQAPQARQETC